MRTNKISLPPISDILVNHLPAPVYQKQPLVPQQQYPAPPQQQLHQGSYSGGSTVLPPLARSTSTPSVPAPPYKYYDYYYGRDPATVPHGHSHGHSASNSVSSTSSVSTAGIAGAAAYPPTRSPLSHNSSPVYSNETTPPPSMIRYSHPQYQQYPPYVPPYQGHPLQQHLSLQHHPHYPPPLHKSLSSPDTRTLSDDDDDVHHLRGNSKRKTRNNLPKETTYILLKWLNDHLNHPYPNSFEKNQLMLLTGLNQQQLSNWFINARRRKIKSLKEQKRLDL